MTFDAVYENGVFRPIEHIDLAEHQVVRVTIRDYPLQTSNPGAKRLNDMIDWE
jgi:predicted DNA-binding antitoxin AbrB/MazE fold protein